MEININSIKNQIAQNLPFVLYCKPNSDTVLGLLQENNTLCEVIDFTEKGFVFASFDGQLKHLIPEDLSSNVTFDRESFGRADLEETIFEPDLKSKNAFEKLVNCGIEAIQNNQFKKVVLSRKETVNLVSLDLVLTFQRLIHFYPTAFVYCFYHPKVGTWLGATPEQLVRSDGILFETIALAGTQKHLGNKKVVWHKKEQEEQQFVTDYIVDKLQDKANNLVVTQPYSVLAGMIWHIKTTITGAHKKDVDLQQIVTLLHPTPAVCGLPKEAAKAFIVNQEQYDRKYYTGYLGELNKKDANDSLSSDLFVNLRTMEIEGEQAHIYIGCGVTKDSSPDKEWEESVNKSKTMKRVL